MFAPDSFLRILVVDDDPVFRRAARRVLGDAALDVVAEAGDAAEARKHAAQVSPDAVLLDVHLPDADGMSLARELMTAWPGLRVVLTSSDAGAEPAGDAIEGVRFVAKADLALVDLAACFRG
jgi:two-component system nitrate/nitrite response regulator NarL